MKCYEFHDMCSGGGRQTKYGRIGVEAESEDEAIEFFKAQFHVDPLDETCECCGPNYDISAHEYPSARCDAFAPYSYVLKVLYDIEVFA